LRLEAVGGKSILAGAERRNAIVGDPDSLIGPDRELLEGLDAKWAAEDAKLCVLSTSIPTLAIGSLTD
jgi:hypothetical protein